MSSSVTVTQGHVMTLPYKELNPDPSETPSAIFIAIPIVALIALIVLICVLFRWWCRKYKGEKSFTKCSSSDKIPDTKVPSAPGSSDSPRSTPCVQLLLPERVLYTTQPSDILQRSSTTC
ncbi:uncharacterized protein LOC119721225 [Patiria miniata]|uniref:Uncharacterized protein n=1 Tax=Patiria miniata TaxID=46514 RepID=A0A913Z8E6_PATMI|nr:uncharacterized protein LOC119721225 [Patiria miniata]